MLMKGYKPLWARYTLDTQMYSFCHLLQGKEAFVTFCLLKSILLWKVVYFKIREFAPLRANSFFKVDPFL